MTPLRPGESVLGAIDVDLIPSYAWRMNTCGGLHTSWLFNVLFVVMRLLVDEGTDPTQRLHLTFGGEIEPHTGNRIIRFDAMAMGQVESNGLRHGVVAAATPGQIRVLIDRDRIAYECTCETVPFRLVPTEINDRYQIQQLHEQGCPMPARVRARPNVSAN